MSNAISLEGVTKVFRLGLFKKKTAVDNVTFSVPKGHIVGLLGPNGSGKSTSIKMIMGFLKPTSGEIFINGRNNQDDLSRNDIGYLPENPRFPKFLTGREIMRFYGGLHGLRGDTLNKRIDGLLETVNLSSAAGERVQGYSKGMTQRLAIAQSLISTPTVLIFDEPMSGLDPLGRIEIRRIISQIHAEMPEVTLFFSTHILNDVESLCSSVILLRNGKLTKHCNIAELIGDENQRFELNLSHVSNALRDRLKADGNFRVTPGGMTIWIEGSTDMLIDRLSTIRKEGAVITSLSSQRKTLEEALFGNSISMNDGKRLEASK